MVSSAFCKFLAISRNVPLHHISTFFVFICSPFLVTIVKNSVAVFTHAVVSDFDSLAVVLEEDGFFFGACVKDDSDVFCFVVNAFVKVFVALTNEVEGGAFGLLAEVGIVYVHGLFCVWCF